MCEASKKDALKYIAVTEWVHEYDNMCEASKKDALKYIAVTEWVHEFNMDFCSTQENPMLKGLNKVLLCNKLILHMKLLR